MRLPVHAHGQCVYQLVLGEVDRMTWSFLGVGEKKPSKEGLWVGG